MKSRILTISLFLFSFSYLFAQNPISPPGVYIADPSAHVWIDGKIYIYGSNDESPNYYCSWVHHVLSSSDLQKWDLTKDVFTSKGQNDQVLYNDEVLFAPDCQYKDGTYYMYFCQPSKSAEGVATSKSPTGPFVNGQAIDTKGISEIDPCVFIDDDGQAYYIWGQFTAKMAKLKPNMTEIDFSSVKDSVITEKEHFFHEGGYMVKRNGIYYFIYASIARANMPTCIGYATSKSPMGPFRYGGVIVDNSHCDPGNWNNHTNNSNMMRKACVEPITFNADGSINEVEMTTQGAGAPLLATSVIEAEQACLLFGNTRIVAFDVSHEKLTGIKNGDKAAYKYINFEAGTGNLEVRVAPGEKAGKIQIALDQPWHGSIGTVDVPARSGDQKWITLGCKVKPTTGVHAVWLRFEGGGDDLFDVDGFKFSK